VWRMKVLVQFLLALLPGGERINYLLQRLKGSHRPSRMARRILEMADELALVAESGRLGGGHVVEIGTGWDGIGAMMLYLLGARKVSTYDHVRHVRYKLARRAVEQIGANLPKIAAAASMAEETLAQRLRPLKEAGDLETLFQRAGIDYVAPGDGARTGLPAGSVDLVYSHAVLEHVYEKAVGELTVEARRVLAPGGVAFHLIGLGDHYASDRRGVSGVNFLKYRPWVWNLWVKNRISYHNRLREKQFIEIFQAHGATVRVARHLIRPKDLEALKTMDVDPTFAGMTREELAVFNTAVVLSFPEAAEQEKTQETDRRQPVDPPCE